MEREERERGYLHLESLEFVVIPPEANLNRIMVAHLPHVLQVQIPPVIQQLIWISARTTHENM